MNAEADHHTDGRHDPDDHHRNAEDDHPADDHHMSAADDHHTDGRHDPDDHHTDGHRDRRGIHHPWGVDHFRGLNGLHNSSHRNGTLSQTACLKRGDRNYSVGSNRTVDALTCRRYYRDVGPGP